MVITACCETAAVAISRKVNSVYISRPAHLLYVWSYGNYSRALSITSSSYVGTGVTHIQTYLTSRLQQRSRLLRTAPQLQLVFITRIYRTHRACVQSQTPPPPPASAWAQTIGVLTLTSPQTNRITYQDEQLCHRHPPPAIRSLVPNLRATDPAMNQ